MRVNLYLRRPQKFPEEEGNGISLSWAVASDGISQQKEGCEGKPEMWAWVCVPKATAAYWEEESMGAALWADDEEA